MRNEGGGRYASRGGKVKGWGWDSSSGEVISTGANGRRSSKFANMDTMTYWLVRGPKSEGWSRRRGEGGAGLNQKKIKATGITIVFAERWWESRGGQSSSWSMFWNKEVKDFWMWLKSPPSIRREWERLVGVCRWVRSDWPSERTLEGWR